MNLQELLDQIANLESMDDGAIAELLTALRAEADARLEEDPTDDVLAELEQIAGAIKSVKAESTKREEDAAARKERRDRIAAEIAEGSEDPEEDDEPAEGAETPEAVAAAAAAAQAAADTAAAALAAAAAKGKGGARTAARRPKAMEPKAKVLTLPDDIADWGLTAAANSPDHTAGTAIRTFEELGKTFLSAIKASAGYRSPARQQVKVVRSGTDNVAELYPADRMLGDDPFVNERKIQSVHARQLNGEFGFAAAGGICAPPVVRYDIPVIGDDERPVWADMLTTYGVERGRVTTINIPVIEDVASGAVSYWTAANDLNPGSDGAATKPCLTVGCPDDTTGVIEAIVQCLKIGNFKARYFGELIAAYMTLINVNAARAVETRHLAAISAGSKHVNSGQLLGTTRDVLTTLIRSMEVIRSRHRVRPASMPFTFAAPQWLRGNMRVDIARQMPVGTLDETLLLADSHIDRWFGEIGLNPVWLLDGPAGQVFGAQHDGDILGWPNHATTWLFPSGTWLGLDGGSLDFGIVRDSVLIGTNDFEMFSEQMQGVHYHGIESWEITIPICADGSASALVDINPCSTGS